MKQDVGKVLLNDVMPEKLRVGKLLQLSQSAVLRGRHGWRRTLAGNASSEP